MKALLVLAAIILALWGLKRYHCMVLREKAEGRRCPQCLRRKTELDDLCDRCHAKWYGD